MWDFREIFIVDGFMYCTMFCLWNFAGFYKKMQTVANLWDVILFDIGS